MKDKITEKIEQYILEYQIGMDILLETQKKRPRYEIS